MALSKEDKKDVSGAFGKKAASAVSKATQDRFNKNPFAHSYKAKMDTKHGESKSKALKSKTGGAKYKAHLEGGRPWRRKGWGDDTRDDFMKELDKQKTYQ